MRLALRYLVSAAAASLAMITMFFWNWGRPDIIMFFIVWMVTFVITSVCVLPAFCVVWRYSEQRKINSVGFFLFGACATSVTFCALDAWWAGSGVPLDDPERLGFFAAFFRFLPVFIVGAVAGGTTFWWCSLDIFSDQNSSDQIEDQRN